MFQLSPTNVSQLASPKQTDILHLSQYANDSLLKTCLLCHTGQFGPAIALIAASYTGCDPPLTVALLTIGVGLNGGIYSGFKVNHLDISPRFAGILMSFTNCLANFAGLLAPMAAGYLTDKRAS
jgi:hypothetical protein